jgi:hypothetical protein
MGSAAAAIHFQHIRQLKDRSRFLEAGFLSMIIFKDRIHFLQNTLSVYLQRFRREKRPFSVIF